MADKDLFDDTTMTFGEHLEVLRVHLWKAIIGLVIATVAAFFFSKPVIVGIQQPVVEVMQKKFATKAIAVEDDVKSATDERGPIQHLKDWWSGESKRLAQEEEARQQELIDRTMRVDLDVREIAGKLHEIAPAQYPALPEDAPSATVTISLKDTDLGRMITAMRLDNLLPRTDSPDEAFMIYMKVSLVVGLIVSSPWIFFQIWQFVAAGLYPNERKYVYTYLPFSLGLFLGGAFMCFYFVIPQVLGFLFDFNLWLGMRPEIKTSTWIMFALVVSLMFGISFQLPLVMLLLERISVVSVKIYREKRRYAILIISILSMVLTPSDPISMMLMLIPLCILYELGILLCARGGSHNKSPFETQPA